MNWLARRLDGANQGAMRFRASAPVGRVALSSGPDDDAWRVKGKIRNGIP